MEMTFMGMVYQKLEETGEKSAVPEGAKALRGGAKLGFGSAPPLPVPGADTNGWEGLCLSGDLDADLRLSAVFFEASSCGVEGEFWTVVFVGKMSQEQMLQGG